MTESLCCLETSGKLYVVYQRMMEKACECLFTTENNRLLAQGILKQRQMGGEMRVLEWRIHDNTVSSIVS